MTLPTIKANFIDSMRPERIHVVTSDSGYVDFLPPEVWVTAPGKKPVLNATEKQITAAKLEFFTSILSTFASSNVRLASFMSVVDGLPLRLNGCKVCRGAFAKEMCRVAIASDIKLRNRAPGLVFLTRPDAIPRMPVNLTVVERDDRASRGSNTSAQSGEAEEHELVTGHRAGVPLGHYDAYFDHVQREPPATGLSTVEGRRRRYYILSSYPRFSIVPDRGLAPAAMGHVNELYLTDRTVAVHTRVTFSVDLAWIADPVLLGHWTELQHWLMQFSIMTAAGPDKGGPTQWREVIAGERNQRAFFSGYIRPLFQLGGADDQGVRKDVRVLVFDFMITLFRNVPAIDQNLFALPIAHAAYQEMTINRRHPTKFHRAGCMKYVFHQIYDGVGSTAERGGTLFWGAVGRLSFQPRPMWNCQAVGSAPGLPTCFPQFSLATVPATFKGKRVVLQCSPYCNTMSIVQPEGLCLFVGQKEHRSKHSASLSLSPMIRNHETGEVARFNTVFPRRVFTLSPEDRDLRQFLTLYGPGLVKRRHIEVVNVTVAP
jgi:hypothetical protein